MAVAKRQPEKPATGVVSHVRPAQARNAIRHNQSYQQKRWSCVDNEQKGGYGFLWPLRSGNHRNVMVGQALVKWAFVLSALVMVTLFIVLVVVSTPPASLLGVTRVDAAERYDQKVESVQDLARRSAQTKKRAPVRLILTADEMSSRAMVFVKDLGSDTNVRQVSIEVADDHLRLTGMSNILGADVQFVAKVFLQVQDNQLRFHVGSLSLGYLPVPGPLRDVVVGHLVNPERVRELEQALEINVTRVDFNEKTLIIEGQTRG